jgi:hypothetical protein
MNPTFKDLVELISALIWPGIALILILAFRREVKAILRVVIERATKVSGFGVEIELAANQVERERLIQPSTPDEKAKALRDLEIARAAARKFDYWMKNYTQPPGLPHRALLLLWLVSDSGSRYVSHDYGVFKTLAEVASKMGYDTLPPPSEKEFMARIAKAEKH